MGHRSGSSEEEGLISSRPSPDLRAVVLTGYLAVLALSTAWMLVGGPMILPIIASLAPAIALLRMRMALSASLALALVAFVWIVLVVFIATRYVPVPPVAVFAAAALVTGATCAAQLWRSRWRIVRGDVTDLVFAGAGGIAWCSTLLLAAVLPSGAPMSWAMMGDAANNVLFAGSLLDEGGIALGAGQNPVPLTAALVALFTLPGSLFGAATAAAQIGGLAAMWSFTIVACCIICGALALELSKRRTALGLIGVAVTSALPLGWVMLAGPLYLGFVNFHLTVAVLCASLVVLLHSRRSVVTSFVTICLSLTAILAIWTPLVVIPAVSLLVLAVVRRHRLVRARGLRLALLIAGMAQPVLFFLALSLPSLLTQGSALEDADGAVYDIRRVLLVVLAAAAVVLGVVMTRVSRTWDPVWVLLAVVGGGGAALAALLWLRRGEESLWSYYQLKLVWFLVALLLVLAVAFGWALASTVSRRRYLAAASGLAALVLVVGVDDYARDTVPVFSRDAQATQSALARIVSGDYFSVGEGDRVYDRVVELMDSSEKTILWNSTDPDEDSIMFWVVQMTAGDATDVALRKYAYYHDPSSMDDLCTMRRLMGPPVTVVTADPDIAERATAACGELGPLRLEH